MYPCTHKEPLPESGQEAKVELGKASDYCNVRASRRGSRRVCRVSPQLSRGQIATEQGQDAGALLWEPEERGGGTSKRHDRVG